MLREHEPLTDKKGRLEAPIKTGPQHVFPLRLKQQVRVETGVCLAKNAPFVPQASHKYFSLWIFAVQMEKTPKNRNTASCVVTEVERPCEISGARLQSREPTCSSSVLFEGTQLDGLQQGSQLCPQTRPLPALTGDALLVSTSQTLVKNLTCGTE